MKNVQSLIDLIDLYVKVSTFAAETLKSHFQEDNLLTGWKSGNVPRRGSLRDLKYEFHGVGCYVEVMSYKIDFDFFEGGKTGGFDLWRLTYFIRESGLSPEFNLDVEFKKAEKRGLIKKRDRDPCSPHLFVKI